MLRQYLTMTLTRQKHAQPAASIHSLQVASAVPCKDSAYAIRASVSVQAKSGCCEPSRSGASIIIYVASLESSSSFTAASGGDHLHYEVIIATAACYFGSQCMSRSAQHVAT